MISIKIIVFLVIRSVRRTIEVDIKNTRRAIKALLSTIEASILEESTIIASIEESSTTLAIRNEYRSSYINTKNIIVFASLRIKEYYDTRY